MNRKLTTEEILRTVFAAIMLICLLICLITFIAKVNTAEDPVARTNYVGAKQYSTRWHGND